MNNLYNLSNDTINEAYSAAFLYGYKFDYKASDVASHVNDLLREAANFPVTGIDEGKFYEEICKIVKRYYLPHLPRGNFLREEGALNAALQHQLIFIGEQTQ